MKNAFEKKNLNKWKAMKDVFIPVWKNIYHIDILIQNNMKILQIAKNQIVKS